MGRTEGEQGGVFDGGEGERDGGMEVSDFLPGRHRIATSGHMVRGTSERDIGTLELCSISNTINYSKFG